MDDVIVQQIEQPAQAIPDYGTIEICASSTTLQSLVDAAVYMWEYPYGCNEQLSTKLIGMLTLQVHQLQWIH